LSLTGLDLPDLEADVLQGLEVVQGVVVHVLGVVNQRCLPQREKHSSEVH
jgi:hypothetical protein